MEDKKHNGNSNGVGTSMVCNSCGAGCGCGCGCRGCDWHSGHHSIGFMILRCLLAIVILAVVFLFGVKLGELKGAYGSGMMMRGGRYGMMYPMMYGGSMGNYPSSGIINRAATSTAP